MKALSVRAPWWWFILHGGKDIENRDWSTRVRGRVLLHAGKWFSERAVSEEWLFGVLNTPAGWRAPHQVTTGQLRACCGCIVGSVEIVDCVRESESPWFCGEYGFVLRNPIAFERPIPCKGALGFFDVSEGIGL